MISVTDPASRKQNHIPLSLHLSNARDISYTPEGKWVIFSDLHMGNGGRYDDFVRNSDLFHRVLRNHYRPKGYTLLLNGDVEELHKFTWKHVHAAWKSTTYALFDDFAQDGRLIKTVGNHDTRLIMDLKDSYPYPMDTVVRMTGLEYPLLFYHGHQVSGFYMRYNDISSIGLRYFVTPLGIMNQSVAHDSRRRHYMERKIYDYSRRNGIISVIGHTHRPLFESLSKADRIRFRIEYLLNRYRKASEHRRMKIEAEISSLRTELVDWKSRKKRSDLQSGLYAEDDVPLPCVFNSGTVIGKRGITCLEISKGKIRLIHWLDSDSGYGRDDTVLPLDGRPALRRRLRQATLNYVMDSMRLLNRRETTAI